MIRKLIRDLIRQIILIRRVIHPQLVTIQLVTTQVLTTQRNTITVRLKPIGKPFGSRLNFMKSI
ncbi:MAG TPA: hypothetical protein V6C65_25685 [Allocoleopsis sp.]